MTITLSPSQLAWVNLPSDQKQVFENISAKDGDPSMDAYDWFEHLVPDQIQDQPEMVEVFMDGGTVTKEVWVPDQGVGSGHYEQVSFEMADKDVSRIQSGANGGEYTTDNTIMEDASANRARGADNMSADEFESVQEANALEAELLDGAEVLTESAETSVTAFETAGSAAEAGDGLLGTVLDGVLPATYGAKLAHMVWQDTEHMPTEERVAVTALAGGTATLATYTALAVVPGLNLVLGGIALYKLGTAAHKWATS